MKEPTPDRTGPLLAGCFALAAFAVAIAAGLIAGVETQLILVRAMTAMAVCYPLGLVAGWICVWVVDQSISPAPSANPALERAARRRPGDLRAEPIERASSGEAIDVA